jgi:hypothetical protein
MKERIPQETVDNLVKTFMPGAGPFLEATQDLLHQYLAGIALQHMEIARMVEEELSPLTDEQYRELWESSIKNLLQRVYGDNPELIEVLVGNISPNQLSPSKYCQIAGDLYLGAAKRFKDLELEETTISM